MSRYALEALLRPPVEFYSTVTASCGALICLTQAPLLMLTPWQARLMAGALMLLALRRGWQGWHIVRYHRNLLRLPRYALTSRKIPISRQRLFLGKGFRWLPIHTQRLYDCLQPEAAHWLRPGWCYRLARHIEKRSEHTLPGLTRLFSADRWLNPVRPLPPVGGNPWLHGVELKECDVTLPLSERSGHTLVLGTTRVGKTRLAELLATQDIRRGEVVIVFDPKGDADLLKRLWTEAQRAGRGDRFILFHLAYPEISARYNAIGRFGRISEVASRLTGQLSGEGNSAAFREFAWRFVNIIARALVALGQRPDYQLISRHVVNIDALFIDYARIVLPRYNARAWEVVAQLAERVNDKNTPRHMLGRDPHVVALEQYLNAEKLYDPILDWQQAIRQKAVVYVGLDALSDAVVAAAVGNSMFADLVSVAGHLYKFGLNDGLPGNSEKSSPINLHCDEFNELMGDEFIPLVNKGGGAGIQVTAYTQTLSDIQARIGSASKAGQVVGNFNNLIMLRVRETATAELLTKQLPQVEVRSRQVSSGVTDTPGGINSFTSNTREQVTTSNMLLLDTAALIQLPKGQAFALLEGGQLWKVRLPLPVADKHCPLPESIAQLAAWMQARQQGLSE
ncbi:TPA: conjugative transfer system coupling protein TraD [Salmonella enterica]|uniref:Conjugative transfer system coupling protein TraD n=2 Tax=Salmonella enterica TaxID=28901 RepID=A0A742R115_SALER|nr:conjugative coupling factor TraD, PFGI-1 class [Salmonella enterica subsp. enterica serovar Koketime]EAM8930568.1 conjugative coupling factor TraD, PFGI-1 class [Salmonella enterica]EBB4437956.1 conjugative transfer system coupling protein TraD [Salmonella enterica]EBR9057164.1 conjugative coupling factor TraD, PFGI-1 class [Salmonella enterica subsp. enterica serovar Koketime]EBR9060206.1 conjugative coupling factor TraD, PFGI-1 class [Salmonella enterica subsp. enterica serovar Koketime]